MLAGWAAFGVAWLASAAPAEHPSFRLQVLREDAAECPDDATVAAAVGARLGYVPFWATATDTLEIRFTRSGEGFQAELRGGQGAQRAFGPSGDCRGLGEAVAAALALVIDPFARPEPVRAQAPCPEPPPPPAVEQGVAVSPPREAWRRTARLWGFIAAVPLVGPSGGVSVGLELRRAWGSLVLEGQVTLPASREVPPGSLSAFSAGGTLLGCLHRAWASLCGAAFAEAVMLTPSGLPGARKGLALQAGPAMRAQVQWPEDSAFRLVAVAELDVPITRVSALAGSEEIWRSPPVFFRGGLGGAFEW